MPSRFWTLNRLMYAVLDRVRSTAARPRPQERRLSGGISLRRARAEDLPALHDIYRASLKGGDQRDLFRRLILRFPQLCWIAHRGEESLGYALGRVDRGLLTREPSAFLFSIAMTEAARGLGVGRAIAEAFRDSARDLGLAELNLEIEEGNEAAFHLYASLGLERLRAPRTLTNGTVYMAARL